MAELWRGPLGELVHDDWFLDSHPDTEVAVVRVDSLPTRDQIRQALIDAMLTGRDDQDWADSIYVRSATDAIVALFGQTEGETP